MSEQEERAADVRALIPRDKFDNTHIEELGRLTDAEIAPILPALLAWIQDINWPVAAELLPVLAAHASALTPLLVKVLGPEERDEIWKRWIVTCLLPRFSRAERLPLLPALRRIAESPTPGEREEGLDEAVEALL